MGFESITYTVPKSVIFLLLLTVQRCNYFNFFLLAYAMMSKKTPKLLLVFNSLKWNCDVFVFLQTKWLLSGRRCLFLVKKKEVLVSSYDKTVLTSYYRVRATSTLHNKIMDSFFKSFFSWSRLLSIFITFFVFLSNNIFFFNTISFFLNSLINLSPQLT